MNAEKKMTAVFIDDDCDDLDLLSHYLYQTGKFEKIHCFESGPDALAFLEQATQLPHVIVIDINLPLMSGPEVLASIRTNPTLAHVPVLIYTGSVYPDDIEITRKGGANGYIVKPSLAEHYSDISLLIAEGAERPLPWVLDNYVQQFGNN